jgi:hypothetical protein
MSIGGPTGSDQYLLDVCPIACGYLQEQVSFNFALLRSKGALNTPGLAIAAGYGPHA